jgi:POT family proton-dependent oligopeptide transporter
MPFGAGILSIRYLMLSIPSDSLYLLYASMGVIVVGNGLFKANAANMVRRIYEGDDAKIDSAFTLYYMAVNVGSTVSMLLTPWIKDNWGWHAGFTVCCAGLLLGLINYVFMIRTLNGIGSPPDDRPVRWDRLGLVLGIGLALVFVVSYVIQHRETLSPASTRRHVSPHFRVHDLDRRQSERAGLIAALILIVETLLFFISTSDVDIADAVRAAQCRVEPELRLVQRPGRRASTGRSIRSGSYPPCSGPIRTWASATATCRSPAVRDYFAVVAVGFFIYGPAPVRRRKVSSWYMIWGYGLLARRAAGQRPRPGDDGALRAGAHGRLHDGRVLRRDRHRSTLTASSQTTRAFRATSPTRSSLAIYTSLFISSASSPSAAGAHNLLLPLMKKLSGEPQWAYGRNGGRSATHGDR